MNRNHRNYPSRPERQHNSDTEHNSGGVWKYTENRPSVRKKRPGMTPGNIDFPKLLSALGINDPKINMLMGLMKGGNSPAALMSMMQQFGKRPY